MIRLLGVCRWAFNCAPAQRNAITPNLLRHHLRVGLMNNIGVNTSTMRPDPAKNDPSRRLLGVAIALLVLGVVLLALSLALGTNPRLLPVGMGFRKTAPYALLAGLGLLVVHALRRPDPEPGSEPNEPTLFGKDTTDFVSHVDRDEIQARSLPKQHH
jgi:hypothetical protein